MRRIIRFVQIGLALGIYAVLACAALAAEKVQWSPTAITDVKSIAGKWEGIMVRTPKSKNDDWVNMTIEDNGDYEFVSYRTIGVFSGKGNLSVKDGKAVAQDEKGNLTLQLLTDKTKNQSMLKAMGKGKDGISYRAELNQAAGASKSKSK
jgi:hypothetical protein